MTNITLEKIKFVCYSQGIANYSNEKIRKTMMDVGLKILPEDVDLKIRKLVTKLFENENLVKRFKDKGIKDIYELQKYVTKQSIKLLKSIKYDGKKLSALTLACIYGIFAIINKKSNIRLIGLIDIANTFNINYNNFQQSYKNNVKGMIM